MDKIRVTLPNGKKGEFPKGSSVSEVLKGFLLVDENEAIAAFADDALVDLFFKLNQDCTLKTVSFDTSEGKKIYWHSTSHIMAQAVCDLFPEVKLAIGPAIDEGFYYDFDKETPFTLEDLDKIEKRMKEIIQKDFPFERKEISKSEALALFEERGGNYKVELISELDVDRVSLYHHDNFIDLCRGPHIPSTGKVKAFKLLKVAGAYWRGSEKNKMLQRIYGISFPNQKELDQYIKRQEGIKRRDHRKLGKELELYSIYDEAGAGLVFWLPKGAQVRRIVEDFWIDQHYKAGYDLVYTPHLAKWELWKKSGHTDFYTDYMYSTMKVEEEDYQIRPMNCPFHMLIYQSKIRSYRDLPLKLAELGTVYRYERSGVLHGLLRVRGFTQDDAHIFCRPDQLEDEVLKLLDFTLYFLKTFGFNEYEVYLATRPEKAIGEKEKWDQAILALKKALEKHQLFYRIDEGGGAFYGPKIDLKIKDIAGRPPWQCTTIQFDFNMPERFDLTYVDEEGQFERPFIIHRALLGALERFFGILIEHYAGAFPLWLSPTQITIMPITDQQREYAEEVKRILVNEGLRVKLDDRNEKINYKIREAESEKIPYMFILGKKEVENKTISVRRHGQGDLGIFNLDEILAKIKEEIKSKSAKTLGPEPRQRRGDLSVD